MEKKSQMGPDILTQRETGGRNSSLRFSHGFPEVYDTGDEDNWKEDVSQGYSGWHDYNLVGYLSKMRFSGVHMTVWARS